ncbi:MAG: energy transducer TonB [Vicinamibacterales bacterium]
MKTFGISHRFAIALAGLLVLPVAGLHAQEGLARAKAYYASAAYEDALQVLESLRGTTKSTEVTAYQVYCLVALDRNDEARQAIESIVQADPFYHPSEAEASPRVRGFFEEVRRPLLPGIIRSTYDDAKARYGRKDLEAAIEGFDHVMALADEVGAEDPEAADLRTLASGFRDLAKAALAPPPPPPPPAAPVEAEKPAAEPVAPPEPPPIPVYGSGDADVVKPEVVSRVMPVWSPTPVESQMTNRGSLELTIDEMGRVLAATITESINPRYDPLLLQAAAQWRFKPATRNGEPVRYRYKLGINLGGGSGNGGKTRN